MFGLEIDLWGSTDGFCGLGRRREPIFFVENKEEQRRQDSWVSCSFSKEIFKNSVRSLEGSIQVPKIRYSLRT